MKLFSRYSASECANWRGQLVKNCNRARVSILKPVDVNLHFFESWAPGVVLVMAGVAANFRAAPNLLREARRIGLTFTAIFQMNKFLSGTYFRMVFSSALAG
jgi:hypothetical protein